MDRRRKASWYGLGALLLPVLAVAMGVATNAVYAQPSSSTGASRGPKSSEKLVVRVVNEAGAPLAGVEVSGHYRRNPGPTASFCCIAESLGNARTGPDGTAVLAAPPFTFREVTLTALRKGWPPQTLSGAFGALSPPPRDSQGRILFVLGPARDVAGRVEIPPDCPAGFVQVAGSQPIVRTVADSAGRFVLRGLAPGTIHVSFEACGRTATVTADTKALRPGSLVVTLSPRAPNKNSYALSAALPPTASTPLPPAQPRAPSPCVPPSAELVVAGDFHTVSVDPKCRFFLAGRRETINRYETRAWTLVRPDGSTLVLGSSSAAPVLGERIALLSPPSDHVSVELVDLGSGQREAALGPIARYALGAGDALVFATAPNDGQYEPVALDIRWRDGKVERLATRAAASFSVFADGRFLVYGVTTGLGSKQEVHLLDLVTRSDRRVGIGARQAWATDDGRTLVVTHDDRVVLHDIARGTNDVLDGSNWRVYGRDLQLQVKSDASTLRRGGQMLPLPFSWPYAARERRVADRFLVFGNEGDAVSVETTTGVPRILGEGLLVPEHEPPPRAGSWLALSERAGRVLLVSLTGEASRAVGRGRPRAVSPEGKWLFIDRELESELELVAVDDAKKRILLKGWGAGFAPDEPATFFHTGNQAYDVARPLYVTHPAHGRSIVFEPRVVDYAILGHDEVLVVVPPGSARRAGIWRRFVAHELPR